MQIYKQSQRAAITTSKVCSRLYAGLQIATIDLTFIFHLSQRGQKPAQNRERPIYRYFHRWGSLGEIRSFNAGRPFLNQTAFTFKVSSNKEEFLCLLPLFN